MAIKIIDQKVFSYGVTFKVVGYYTSKKLGVVALNGEITAEQINLDKITIADSSNLFWVLKDEVRKDIINEIIKTLKL